MPPEVSVVICTRNGARSLPATLASVLDAIDDSGLACELIVVDSGSSDGTSRLARLHCAHRRDVRILRLDRPGKSRALNTAVAAARGRVVLCTDDDVSVPSNWVAALAAPVLRGDAEVVGGSVRLPQAIRDSLPTAMHLALLADTAEDKGHAVELGVGASVAYSREIFDSGGSFDEQLGPGALGFMEESLLHRQVIMRGGRAVFVSDAPVMHLIDVRRLTFRGWMLRAWRQGLCEAYIDASSGDASGGSRKSLAIQALRHLVKGCARYRGGVPNSDLLLASTLAARRFGRIPRLSGC